jgi:hypothetical protein
MIYRLRFDRFNYRVFDISAYEIEFMLGDMFLLDEPLWREFWKPLCAQFSDDSDNQNVMKLPDITCWFTDRLALNKTAYDALSSALEPYGELLPVTCEGVPYWIMHVTQRTGMDVVDLTKSQREVIEECEYIGMQALAFKEEKLKDLLVFQTEFSGYRNIYCTEKFKTLIEATGLKGLLFSTDLACVDEP